MSGPGAVNLRHRQRGTFAKPLPRPGCRWRTHIDRKRFHRASSRSRSGIPIKAGPAGERATSGLHGAVGLAGVRARNVHRAASSGGAPILIAEVGLWKRYLSPVTVIGSLAIVQSRANGIVRPVLDGGRLHGGGGTARFDVLRPRNCRKRSKAEKLFPLLSSGPRVSLVMGETVSCGRERR